MPVLSSTTSDDASAAHRLPRQVEPRRYELHLKPDLGRASFEGTVRIDTDVRRPVRVIVLNAAELAVDDVDVRCGDTPVGARAVLDEESERLTLELDAEVPPGPCTITVRFTGVLNDHLRGFYRSTFSDDTGTERTIATTQFEPTDARRAFPCFDEPDRKAVFAVTLDVPAGLDAFSNGPVVEETALDDGARRLRFADTIAMSTYLVAFIVGPLEATAPVDVDGVPVRVVHVPGKGHLADFALDVAAKALRFFASYFAIAYPAEKLDLVALPDFAMGAMENLGCVTFRETALLVDPARASRLEQERVADVVNHELAHMWFGDLVTMRWWNGIWLNEAFATFMELLATDAFRPEWHRWVSFGMERDMAMATDALHATRPVEYPVGSPSEADGMFDVLTYQKGASVLRMLERYLGAETFRDGIRRYLDAHRLGNTETADLWAALEEASGEPVGDIMDTWILQGGFPLVSVESSGRELELSQEPFSFGPSTGSSAIGTAWKVPVLARSVGDGTRAVGALVDDPSRLTLDGDGPGLANAGGSGYYRVRYRPEHLRRLAGEWPVLEELERFNLLGDTWAAVLAARSELDDLLVLAEALGGELDPDVWSQVTGALGFLERALEDDDLPVLAAYTRTLVSPALDRLGWAPGPDESERTRTLRAQLVSSLGTVGSDGAVVERCRELLAGHFAGTALLDPDLAPAVVGVVATNGAASDFDELLEHYRHPDTPQEEMRYLQALAAFKAPELAARAFELALGEVRTQNAPFFIHGLLANRVNGAATWERVMARWDEIEARTPPAMLRRLLEGVRFLFRDEVVATEARRFLADHPVAGGTKAIDQALERLSVNLAFTARVRLSAPPVLHAATRRLAGGGRSR